MPSKRGKGFVVSENVQGVPPPPRTGGPNWGKIIAIGCGGLAILGLLMVGGCLALVVMSPPSESGSSGAKKNVPPAKEAEPVAEPEPIVLSGNGQTATDPFDFETGLAIANMTYQGDRNFIVYLLDDNGSRVGQSLVNAIGSFEGSQAVQTKSGQHLLDVQASGPWTITIEQPRPSSAPQTTSFNGTGQTATDAFQLSKGLTTFNMTHQGGRNFIVYLVNKDGTRVGTSLVNEIGPFEGSKAIQVPKDDIYLLDVQADGPWMIQVD